MCPIGLATISLRLHEHGGPKAALSSLEATLVRQYFVVSTDFCKMTLVRRGGVSFFVESFLGSMKGEAVSLFFEQQRHGLLSVPYRGLVTGFVVIFLSLANGFFLSLPSAS